MRRAPTALAACLPMCFFLGAMLCPVVAVSAEAEPSVVPVSAEQLSTLRSIPRPAIDRLDERDRAQLEARRATLDALLAADAPDVAALSRSFGEAGAFYFLYEFAQAAVACFANAHDLAPDAFEWIYYLGVIESQEGKLEQAVAHFDRAIDIRPNDLPTLLRIGLAQADLGQWDDAEATFRRALSQDPDSASARHGLGRVAAGRKEWEAAIEQFERALSLQPEATVIHHQLGLAWRERGDLERARHHLRQNSHRQVLFEDPLVAGLDAYLQSGDEWTRMGLRAFSDGQLDTAIRAFQRAVAEDDSRALAHYNLGRAHAEKGDGEAARLSFEAALARDPSYRDAHVNLAFLLADAGQLSAAEPHFARAVALDPLDLEARHSWAVALAQLGRDSGAQEVLTALLDEPSLNAELRARAHADLGRLAEKSGRGTETLEHFTAAVAAFPDEPAHRRSLAGVLGRLGRFEEAAEQFQSLLARAPDDVESRFGAVMAYLLGAQYEQARALLEEGIAAQPDAVPLRHLLARVLATAPDAQTRDGARALTLAQDVFRAVRNLDHAQTVAMAFAESGDFASAIAWQERVIAQARQVGRTPVIPRAEQRLARYRAGEPVRSPWKDG